MKKSPLVLLLIIVSSILIVGLASADFDGPYEMQTWNSSGIPDGTTTITPSAGITDTAEFSYAVSGVSGGVSERTATFSNTAAWSGCLSFDWSYNFHHAWFSVFADFFVFADGPSGVTTVHEVDINNKGGEQTINGSSIIWVEEGYEFGFEVGGSNFDSSGFLNGTLTVSNFEPETSCFSGPYEMQNWNSAGMSEGTTTITPSTGITDTAEFSYAVSGLSKVTYRTAFFTNIAAWSGFLTFDWEYSYNHAWYQSHADFWVYATGGKLVRRFHLVDSDLSGAQTVSGTTTIWLDKGYIFGFEVGGSNHDDAGFLNGTLTVTNFVQDNKYYNWLPLVTK